MDGPGMVGIDGETVASASIDGVGITDDGTVVHATDAFATTFGFASREDVIGSPWRELYPAAARERLETEVLPAVRTGESWQGDETGRRADGSTFEQTLSLQRGAGDAVVWVVRETTERLARERQLEQYETIVETIRDGIYVLDEELRFTFANDRFCELFGRSREEIIGTAARALYDDEEAFEQHSDLRERLVDEDDDGGTIRAALETPTGERILESRYRLHPEPTGGEYRGSVGVVRDVTDVQQLQQDLREEKRFVENVVDALDDVLYVVDESGRFAFWNEELTERFGYDDAEMAELDPWTVLEPLDSEELPPDAADIVDLPDRHTVVDLTTKDGETITHELYGVTYADDETGERYRVGVGRDITGRLERERALQRQRDELATLDRINELLLKTVRALLHADGRGAVERTVCDRLTADDRYRVAWIGERAYDGDGIVPRTIGEPVDDAGALDGVDRLESAEGPVATALGAGEVRVTDDAAALGYPGESVAAVPLRHVEHVHGVLVIHASTPDGFTNRERDGFGILGRTVGFVVHAARNRELLFADSVVELEFQVGSAGDLLEEPATRHDCELWLDGYVASGDDWILYLSVDGTSPEAIVSTLDANPRVERARVVTSNDAGGRIELVVEDATLFDSVQAMGATVRSARVRPDGGRLAVEVPLETDVRELVDRVLSAFPDAELIATTEHDRPLTGVGRPEGLLDALTDRQREVLEAAYRGGYFAWPRESTAEAVAESLDISAPTLHAHLRKAEAAILARLLDAE